MIPPAVVPAFDYVELFAGAAGLSLGLEAAGGRCLAHCEVDRHARAVLRRRWPGVPLLGDVAQVDGRAFRGAALVSGGSPCQGLSQAGHRRGLADPRSGLFRHQARVWDESGAAHFLWENVVGALSCSDGRDFAAVLAAVVGAPVVVPGGGWRGAGLATGPAGAAAWRVLDLRAWRPQQRRRVYLFGTRAGGIDPVAVLHDATGGGGSAAAGGGDRHLAPAAAPAGAPGVGGRPDAADAPLFFHNTQDPISAHYAPTLGVSSLGAGVLVDGRLRRTTPREAERLNGWPDDHTADGLDEDGTPYALPDGPRYKLCGNGVGAPVAEWIGRRFAAVLAAARAAA